MRKAPLNGSLGRTNYGAVTVTVRKTVPVVPPLPLPDTDTVTFPRDAFATAVNTSDPDECDPVRVSGVAVTPVGRPAAFIVRAPVNPPARLTVTATDPVPPATTVARPWLPSAMEADPV